MKQVTAGWCQMDEPTGLKRYLADVWSTGDLAVTCSRGTYIKWPARTVLAQFPETRYY